ncbi:hypothetical protein DV736_g5613, partial [Chaetothyriales sp. CBS 134916]
MAKLAPDYRSLTPDSAAANPEYTSRRGLKRKRTNTKVACNNCRLRKWACDGDRPHCLQCRKNGIDCVYTSVDKSETHIGILKRENEVLRQRSENLEELLGLLKSAPVDLAQMALLKLRHDPASALGFVRGVSPESHLSEQTTARAYLPDIPSDLEFELMARYPFAYPIPNSQVPLALKRRQSSYGNFPSGASSAQQPTTQEKAAFKDDDLARAKMLDVKADPWAPPQCIDSRLSGLDIAFWTNVSASNELAAGAISFYLETDHPFLGLFDADLFLDSLQGYSAKNPLALSKSYEFKREAEELFTVEKSSDSSSNLAGIVMLWLSHMLQTLYARPVATSYPPVLPIPGCVETDASPGDDAAENLRIKFSGPGDIFQSFCKFWKTASDIILKYRPTEGESNATLEFTLSEYHKILALTSQLPVTMACIPGAASHVFVFHVFLHAIILDIFRPFIADKDQRTFRSLSRNAPSPPAIFAASIRRLKQMILIFSNYPESTWEIFWHISLMYVANAVVKDRKDPEWRPYFFLCLHQYKILARCFSLIQWIVPGLLTIAVQYGAISSSEANSIKERFRKDQRIRRPEGSGAGFVLDMDLAVRDWSAAQADTLAAEFEDLSLFNEFTAGIV